MISNVATALKGFSQGHDAFLIRSQYKVVFFSLFFRHCKWGSHEFNFLPPPACLIWLFRCLIQFIFWLFGNTWWHFQEIICIWTKVTQTRACTCECKCRNNWPCARAPVNTHPAQTHTHTCTLTVTKVNKWQSDGNYGPWWNNQHNGWAAPMFSLIKANSHPNQTITHRVSAGARVSAGRSECIYGHWGSLWKHSCGAACNKPTAHSHDVFRFVLNGSKSSLVKSLLLLSLEGKDACGGRCHQCWCTVCSDDVCSCV